MPFPETNSIGNRILVVDDNDAIHDDFRKVLCGDNSDERLQRLRSLERSILGGEDESAANHFNAPAYIVDSAFQGEEALEMVQKSELQNAPYALVFMDIRMPPGWDGIETIRRIWEKHPHIEMVICTAYSDHSWEEILNKVGNSDLQQFRKVGEDLIPS